MQHMEICWSLYFTTLYIKTTLIIRTHNLVPKCDTVYYRTFILGYEKQMGFENFSEFKYDSILVFLFLPFYQFSLT